ncbi:OmpA family protein [Paenimyroides tangerinum]|uniref:OmpA family protein n=1 Tax=Paenimyroides tangerinum TaxID=2488728 RepID=A0A3P3WEC2_9FLAO|nr:OmpA family protein [Paenimyroides tangerinum]RRJ91989.1 OmpA family protein [Paenimyroides tangerinum]
MKKTGLLLFTALLIISCNQKNKENEIITNDTLISNETSKPIENSFNIENISVSTADIGVFPFINLPKGLKEMNKPLVREFDVCFFPIEGIMTPFEGKLYKTFVSPNQGENFSQHFFEKSMSDYLLSIGAIKVFDGEITKEEYDRYNKKDPNKGDEGDIGYAGQNIKFWVLRTKNDGNIYVQYISNNAGASLNVLQETAFEQSITKVTAEEISSDLIEKGKAVLYINFDVDKSTISNDGIETVNEIAVALKNNPPLKISIEGHTDNSGNSTHNKTLSANRAEAVKEKLTSNGIDKNRLSTVGFGSEKPIATNDSEENKAKNRRVELVKIN